SVPGATSNAAKFTVYGQPTLQSIVPSSGQPSTNPTITLTGSEFVAGVTAVTVAGSGTPITTGTVNVTNSITLTGPFTIPAAASGDYAVSVTTDAGISNALVFTVTPSTPTLTQVSPNYGFVLNAPNPVSVTLGGTNFIPDSTTVAVNPPNDITVNLGAITS